jgi:adenylylsulfate kinase
MKGWALWITGLPGSGKTERAKEVLKKLEQKNVKVQHLRMDEIRKILTPERKYTEEERDHAYRALVLIGKFLTENGINVIIDATGHRRIWRDLARELIPNFAEVYVKCPLETCIERESKRKDNLIVSNLYKKAMDRIKTGEKVDGIGEMIGVDVSYEEPEKPELIIESDKLNPKESSEKIFQFINKKF